MTQRMPNKITGANSRPASQFVSRGLRCRALVVGSHGRYHGGAAVAQFCRWTMNRFATILLLTVSVFLAGCSKPDVKFSDLSPATTATIAGDTVTIHLGSDLTASACWTRPKTRVEGQTVYVVGYCTLREQSREVVVRLPASISSQSVAVVWVDPEVMDDTIGVPYADIIVDVFADLGIPAQCALPSVAVAVLTPSPQPVTQLLPAPAPIPLELPALPTPAPALLSSTPVQSPAPAAARAQKPKKAKVANTTADQDTFAEPARAMPSGGTVFDDLFA